MPGVRLPIKIIGVGQGEIASAFVKPQIWYPAPFLMHLIFTSLLFAGNGDVGSVF